ncbi:methyl-accepting chemotaxis protein [Desulfatirhabdium butyrativorans]|uniref:methyl-accepting chemotaxis protein n=1 Tax=Desulfatirhabdium butyrativorans TaxID=340467 RepID=UPI0004010584|nr:methyl-accepting chemotaxis protein [Desulfatirhabdium butyrativorans]
MNPVNRMILAIRNRMPSSSLSSATIRERLDRDNRALHELASTTEGEFIRIGEQLQDFYFRTRKLADLSKQVAGQLTGESWLQWMAELNTIFGRIRQQDEQGTRGAETLDTLLQRFDVIRARLTSFDGIVRNLHVLCNYIKIESARLGKKDTGFFALGEDVRTLADSITEKSGNLDRQSRHLMETIREGMGRIAAIESAQAGQSRSILAQADRNLEAMADHNRASSRTLEEISESWTRISKSIGEMVASMQFHDISRQRIEHVRDALLDTRNTFGPNADPSGNGLEAVNPVRKNGWIGHLLNRIRPEGQALRPDTLPSPESARAACLAFEVQTVQLHDTAGEITGAVERIIHHLRQVATELSAMTEQTRSLTAAGTERNGSFLSELETQLAQLADAIAGYGGIQRQWAASLAQVTTSVGEMSGFIRQIEAIGFQMKLIALNAAIHAAHIGQEGAALGVLADAIRQLADDTATHIEAIASDLKALVDQAGRFTRDRNACDTDHSVAEIDDLPAVIQAMAGSLKSMDKTVSGLLAQIDQDGSGLMQDIETGVSGITVHERMGRLLQQIAADLEAMVQEIRGAFPDVQGVLTEQTGEGKDGSDRYTMEREREIHRSIAAAAAAGAVAGAAAAATIEETGTLHPGALQSDAVQPVFEAPPQAADTDGVDLSDILFDMDGPPEDAPATDVSVPDSSPAREEKVEPDERPDMEPDMETASGNDGAGGAAEQGEEDLGDNVELF